MHDLADRPTKAQLAHELRTPLAAIHSLADIIAEERFGPVENDRYRSYAASMRDAAAHLIAVVEAMLADPLAEKQPNLSDVLAVELGAVARSVAALLAEIAGRRLATLRLELASENLSVSADKTAVTEMVINLASNALRHAPLGVVIAFRTGRDHDGRAWIEIEDNGPGLPPKIAAIYASSGPPATANHAETRAPCGKRLGLPLTAELARANGATLSFRAAVPTGTAARIAFPPGSRI